MDIPEDDNVIRYIEYKFLLRDDKGVTLGLLPQAFELRDIDNGKLSISWLEYCNEVTHQKNIDSSVKTFRKVINNHSNNCGYGIGKVKTIKEVGSLFGTGKINIVHSPSKKNKAHSSIIRIPNNDWDFMAALAEDAFLELILDSNIP